MFIDIFKAFTQPSKYHPVKDEPSHLHGWIKRDCCTQCCWVGMEKVNDHNHSFRELWSGKLHFEDQQKDSEMKGHGWQCCLIISFQSFVWFPFLLDFKKRLKFTFLCDFYNDITDWVKDKWVLATAFMSPYPELFKNVKGLSCSYLERLANCCKLV